MLSVFQAEPSGARGMQLGPVIFDGHGRPLWFKPVPQGWYAMNLRVQVYRGEPVLTWWEGTFPGHGSPRVGEGVIVDSSYREIARVRAGTVIRSIRTSFCSRRRGRR